MPLLLLIRLYWALWPASARRTCLFRQSCSRHVYRITRRQGLLAGWQALRHRQQQCRAGACGFQHPLSGAWFLWLPDGTFLPQPEVARHLWPAIR
ncbi:MAG: membrane protein insertion efficiency factor YidD [Janthinobacterium lividum]